MPLAAILVLQTGLLLWQASHTGVTVDEPAHLVSSLLYRQGRDILLPRDMPPLVKMVAGTGLQPEAAGLNPAAVKAGQWEWEFANQLMHRDDSRWIGPVFSAARRPMLLFPVLTTVLVFLWARANLGQVPAVAAAAIFAFDPTSLAHGALVKNDHAATFAYFCFAAAAWRYSHRPALGSLSLLAVAAWMAVSAKLSLVVVVPIAAILIPFVVRSRFAVLHLGVFVTILLSGMYSASYADLAALTPHDLAHSSIGKLIPVGCHPLLTGYPVPRHYWNGLDSLVYWNGNGDNAIYLLGRHVPSGSPWYFLTAILVKTPEPFLVLLAAGAWLLRGLGWGRALFLILPPALYIGAASATAMQLGIRLILPALPFAALLAAVPFCRWPRTAAVALFISLTATGVNFPNGIGYFNLSSGGAGNGLRYLADSNIDWGQDLPALRRWVDQEKAPKMRLYYFGNDNPFRFFNDNEIEPQAPPWGPDLVKSELLVPEPGLYAISANLLPGHAFPVQFRNYFHYFRDTKPLAIAGTSIYLFHVEANGVK
ncbi:MAG: hypothetical protein JNM66_04035 [Bryobacterales bacterium]|nr:hypothetical protein [Bryobacterales bacterium]